MADKLFVDATTTMFLRTQTDPETFVAGLIAKCLACAQVGELTVNDFDGMSACSRIALSNSLRSIVPKRIREILSDQTAAYLPLVDDSISLNFAAELVRRPRLGYEGPDGRRFQGPRPESQGAHALTTAVIAGLRSGYEAALAALMHNAHLSLMPDYPRWVAASLGADAIQQARDKALRQILYDLPGRGKGPYTRFALKSNRSENAEMALLEADFIDRTLWLLEIAPSWLDPNDHDQLRQTLCDKNYRLELQLDLLERILTNQHSSDYSSKVAECRNTRWGE